MPTMLRKDGEYKKIAEKILGNKSQDTKKIKRRRRGKKNVLPRHFLERD